MEKKTNMFIGRQTFQIRVDDILLWGMMMMRPSIYTLLFRRTMDTMTAIAHDLPRPHISLEQEDSEKLTVTPWFSFRVATPCQPLPSLDERPVLCTERLTIRPIVSTDLEAFHALRSCCETQVHCPSRGRVDRDIEESRENIEWMRTKFEEHRWFGAFLSATRELIGEGGLPDCNNMFRSGWPEAELR